MNTYQSSTSNKTRFAAAALVATVALPALVGCAPASASPLSPLANLAPVTATVEPVVNATPIVAEVPAITAPVDETPTEAVPTAQSAAEKTAEPDAPVETPVQHPELHTAPVAVSVESERLAKCEPAPEIGPDDDRLDIAVKFITAEEGFDKNWVDIGDGMWTIGYGHAVQKSEPKDVKGPLTKDEAAALLRKDLAEMNYVPAVDKWFDEDLNDVTYAMMVSFAYNAGPGGFRKYDIPKSDVNEIAQAIEHASDHHANKFPGLICRRAREATLIRGSVDAIAL